MGFFVLILIGLTSAEILAQWDLLANESATQSDDDVNPGNFVAGPGINNLSAESPDYTTIISPGGGTFSITPSGASANGWSNSSLNSDDYFQISLSPKLGFSLNINSINFGEARRSDGITEYQVQWSKDLSFSSPTSIATVNVPDNDLGRMGDISGLNINVDSGETIYIRFFGYNAEFSDGPWSILASINNAGVDSPLRVEGTTFIFCGDVNNDGESSNILDLTYLVDYIFRGGPAPVPLLRGDLNNDDKTNILDLTYLVNYIFRGGPEPIC